MKKFIVSKLSYNKAVQIIFNNIRYSSNVVKQEFVKNNYELSKVDDELKNWQHEMEIIKTEESRSILESSMETTKKSIDVYPLVKPTFNLAAYVNTSETLQQFIKLGVDLHRIEKHKGWLQFVLNLEFEQNVRQHLMFLTKNGIGSDDLGTLITKNPLIFKENLDDLQTRISYLESKKFDQNQIIRILLNNPFWLMLRTQRIDKRLGFFQKNFVLSGNEVRCVATKQPKLITYNLKHVRESTFSIKEELGFSKDETKQLILAVPKIWMMNKDIIIERFNYVHNVMKLSHERILQSPEIFYCRLHRMQQRHMFLKHLGLAQYDPKKDLYISLLKLSKGNDQDFVINVAKSTFVEFDSFLRTL